MSSIHPTNGASGAGASERTGVRLAATLCVTLLLAASTATAGDPVYIWPEFDKGDRFSLELAKTDERHRPGQPDVKVTVTIPVDVEVLEINAAGILLSWTYGKPEPSDPIEITEPPKALIDATAGIRLEIQIDERGVITGLRNFTEVKKQFQEMMEVLIREREDGSSPEKVRKLRKKVEDILSTKESIEHLTLRVAQMYLLPIGWNLDPDAPTEYDDFMANPIGDPIPAKTRISLVDYKPGAKATRIEVTARVEPETGGESIIASLRQMDAAAGEPEPLDDVSVEISDKYEFTIDAEFGWITEARTSRLVRSGDLRSIDTTVFRLKTHQPAQAVDKGTTTTDKQPSP